MNRTKSVVEWGMAQNTPRKTHAFTLIELLVVISIITILAAMLIPSLRSSLASARSLACKNNIKQIHVATILYGDDWNQVMVPTNWVMAWASWGGMSAEWNNFLRSYVGEDNDARYYFDNRGSVHPTDPIFQCPGSFWEQKCPIWNQPRCGYAINQGVWKWNNGYVSRGSIMSGDGVTYSLKKPRLGPGNKLTKWSNVRAPSNNILYVDHPWAHNSLNYLGCGESQIWRPDYMGDCYKDTTNSDVRNLHPAGKLNYSMFDGHVESLYYEETWGEGGTYYYPIGMWTWGDD